VFEPINKKEKGILIRDAKAKKGEKQIMRKN